MATKELAYPASSSPADDLGSLVGGLKSQLNNLLDSIAIPPPQEGDGGLRPGRGGLGVLEEEGSDVGSAAMGGLSPRSPRSPAVPPPPPKGEGRSKVASQHDSSVLGFNVDENGLATPAAPSKPTSVLSSLTNLPSTTAATGGFASLFAKRLKQATEGASDLLREAERRLGNAMTLDDLPTQPKIQLEEASFDSELSPWYEAAGGTRKTSSDSRRSPTLHPTRVSAESGRSSLSLPGASSPQPSSPPIGGAPGGMFALMGRRSGEEKRSSGDWGWGEEWEGEGSKRASMVSVGSGIDEESSTPTLGQGDGKKDLI